MLRARSLVFGRVQGVGFRAFVKKSADTHSVFGAVQNLEDGSVEAVFEGEKKDVEAVLRLMSVGPRFSKVREQSVQFEDWLGEYKDFSVLR